MSRISEFWRKQSMEVIKVNGELTHEFRAPKRVCRRLFNEGARRKRIVFELMEMFGVYVTAQEEEYLRGPEANVACSYVFRNLKMMEKISYWKCMLVKRCEKCHLPTGEEEFDEYLLDYELVSTVREINCQMFDRNEKLLCDFCPAVLSVYEMRFGEDIMDLLNKVRLDSELFEEEKEHLFC